ncbi:cobalamin B12-binding domain-containing protein [Salinarimonas soli]|uniref:Cobalamin B12-binding domain-containing protein n=1 Tax=Salinarimonas soli TaxID=1638099 RepID=A0A5B2VHX7_9HYPH|nr:cobalamin B12-binding domain-containing protein [Salinarimonas soli]KAA2238090.1 cobalamin B12-binding domain-containing protein [Salinarimonas soli]
MARFDDLGGMARMHSNVRHLVREPLPVAGADPGRLAHMIETQIIPRLMLLHGEPDRCDPYVPIAQAEVTHFAGLVLTRDTALGAAYLASLRARGASLEAIFLSLFAPTARLLGDLWREDVYSFAEVTIGLSRLQQLLRGLSAPFEELDGTPPDGRLALLAATPGEQHSFGLSLVETFLRRAGWEVEVAWGADERRLKALVRSESFDLVGFSLSCDVLLEQLSSTIHAVKQASRNRGLKVIVGGRYFTAHPEMVARVGADAGAVDARDATAQADRLVIAPAASVPR